MHTRNALPRFTRTLRRPRASHDFVLFINGDIADAVIAEQAAHYRELGAEVEWKVYQHDGPPDLLQRVERYGFIAGPQETVLVLDLQNHASWIDEPPAHPVIRIENEDHVDSVPPIGGRDFRKRSWAHCSGTSLRHTKRFDTASRLYRDRGERRREHRAAIYRSSKRVWRAIRRRNDGAIIAAAASTGQW